MPDDVTETQAKLQELEEKLLRAAEVFKQHVSEKRALQRELDKLKEGAEKSAGMENELKALRREREDVRMRLEKLLKQIDSLTKADSAG
jgi:SMC interacting uncharacterized protein involved in chromosome segregation